MTKLMTLTFLTVSDNSIMPELSKNIEFEKDESVAQMSASNGKAVIT